MSYKETNNNELVTLIEFRQTINEPRETQQLKYTLRMIYDCRNQNIPI